MATLTLRPNAAGTYQTWTRVGGSNHWGVTSDESDSTYLYSLSTSDKETENLADTAQTGIINSVTAYIRAKAPAGGGAAETAVILWRTHSADYESTTITISRTAFTNYSQAKTVNPNTGVAWTWDEINALEVGARAYALGVDEEIDVSEIWIVVDYTATVDIPTDAITKSSTAVPSLEIGTAKDAIAKSSATASLALASFSKQYQQNCFCAHNRLYMFYVDDTNIVYKFRTLESDTWSSPVTVRAVSSGKDFSIFFDGYSIHYVYTTSSAVYYRKGAIAVDHTITWQTEVYVSSQTVYSPANVAVDSGGYPFIGLVMDYVGKSAVILKGSANNGTWGTTSYYKFTVACDYCMILPLTATKMYAVYGYENGIMYGKQWSGSGWGTPDTIESSVYSDFLSCTTIQDDLYISFCTTSPHYIKVRERIDSVWKSADTIESLASPLPPALIAYNPSRELFCLWTESPNKVVYKGKWKSQWRDKATYATESESVGNKVVGSMWEGSGVLCFTYAASVTVKLGFFDLGIPSEALGTRTSGERKTFFHNGRYWIFFGGTSNWGYYTSRLEFSPVWATPVTIGYKYDGAAYMNTWFDGTYVYYVRLDSATIYFRRGTPNSDGTITWSQAEQTVGSADNDPAVCVDSDGYPFVAGQLGAYGIRVWKASLNNGTFTNPTIWNFTDKGHCPALLPLPNNKIYLMTYNPNNYLFGKIYDGSSWSDWEQCSYKTCSGASYTAGSAIADEDGYVYMVYLTDETPNQIYHRKRLLNGTWETETLLATSLSTEATPNITRNGTNQFITWLSVKTYYVKRWTGTWETTQVFAVEDRYTMPDLPPITSFYREYGGIVAVAYVLLADDRTFIRVIDQSAVSQIYTLEFDAPIDSTEIVSPSLEISLAFDSVAKSQGVQGSESTFNVSKDASSKNLSESLPESTFNVSKESITKTPTTTNIESEYVILNDSLVKNLATFLYEFSIASNASSKATALANLETSLNIATEAFTKSLTVLNIETEFTLPNDAISKNTAQQTLEKTLNILKDALSQSVLASVLQESQFNLAKDSTAKTSTALALESQYNLLISPILNELASLTTQTQLNIPKDAISKQLASAIVGIELKVLTDALAKASSLHSEELVTNILKDAISKTLASITEECGFSLSKDALARLQATIISECAVSVGKDAVSLSTALKVIGFEIGVAFETVAKCNATKTLELLLNISKDSISKTSSSNLFELGILKGANVNSSALNVFELAIIKDTVVRALESLIANTETVLTKDAITKLSSTRNMESVFSVLKDAMSKSQEALVTETQFNINKEALQQLSALWNMTVTRISEYFFDAVTKQQATYNVESQLRIDKNSNVKSSSLATTESLFNINTQATVKALDDFIVEWFHTVTWELAYSAVTAVQAQASRESTFGINAPAAVKTDPLKVLELVFNITKDSVQKTIGTNAEEIVFNLSKDATAKGLASIVVGLLIEIYKTAIQTTNVQLVQESMLTIRTDAVQRALGLLMVQTTLSLIKEAVAKASDQFSLGSGALASFPLEVVLYGETGIVELEGEKGEVSLTGENGEVILW